MTTRWYTTEQPDGVDVTYYQGDVATIWRFRIDPERGDIKQAGADGEDPRIIEDKADNAFDLAYDQIHSRGLR